MKSIAIDMDGVLADVYSRFLKLHYEEYGQSLTMADVEGIPERDAIPGILKYVNSEGFFRNATLIPGCQKYIGLINERYKLYIVSAAMEFPLSLMEKQLWLQEYFPFITWQQIVFCGSKEIIKADIMIDDHFKNLDYFTGETLLFTQPHNKFTDPGKHRRVNTWEEIGQILLP
ncbi:MAG: 5'(3')-deoxyribonucleotidase [Ginsengibacter sp.]